MSTQVLNPVDCAKEIVQVLEKHKITIFEMDKVLETAKGLACSSTHIQSEKESASKAVRAPKKPISLKVLMDGKIIFHQSLQTDHHLLTPDEAVQSVLRDSHGLSHQGSQGS